MFSFSARPNRLPLPRTRTQTDSPRAVDMDAVVLCSASPLSFSLAWSLDDCSTAVGTVANATFSWEAHVALSLKSPLKYVEAELREQSQTLKTNDFLNLVKRYWVSCSQTSDYLKSVPLSNLSWSKTAQLDRKKLLELHAKWPVTEWSIRC